MEDAGLAKSVTRVPSQTTTYWNNTPHPLCRWLPICMLTPTARLATCPRGEPTADFGKLADLVLGLWVGAGALNVSGNLGGFNRAPVQ